jgi:hypothetical protein
MFILSAHVSNAINHDIGLHPIDTTLPRLRVRPVSSTLAILCSISLLEVTLDNVPIVPVCIGRIAAVQATVDLLLKAVIAFVVVDVTATSTEVPNHEEGRLVRTQIFAGGPNTILGIVPLAHLVVAEARGVKICKFLTRLPWLAASVTASLLEGDNMRFARLCLRGSGGGGSKQDLEDS